GNPRSIGAWRARVEAGERAASWSEAPDARARLGETWWLGLRRAIGVDPEEARSTAGFGDVDRDADPAAVVAEKLLGLGLLVREGERFALSERGLPLADAVAREFLGL